MDLGTRPRARRLPSSAASGKTETHEEEEGIAVTAWGDRYEVFAEADPLVVGQLSKSHTHVTILDEFPPLREGIVTAVLRAPAGAEHAFRQEKALRDGIFSIEIKPTQAGVFDLAFKVESPAGTETIPAGRVRVGEGDSLGLLVEPPHYGPAGMPRARRPQAIRSASSRSNSGAPRSPPPGPRRARCIARRAGPLACGRRPGEKRS